LLPHQWPLSASPDLPNLQARPHPGFDTPAMHLSAAASAVVRGWSWAQQKWGFTWQKTLGFDMSEAINMRMQRMHRDLTNKA